MQIRTTFKHMKTSQAIAEYAENKTLQKIEKFSTKPIEAHLTFSVEGRDHRIHCSVIGGDGFNCQVDATSQDMYGSIDIMIHKLESQLKKHKEKLKHHKNNHNVRILPLRDATNQDSNNCDEVPVEAVDLLKYEHARRRASC